MRHRKSFNHLGRQAGHRKAMLANMASSLILHKRINTTVAKAKALRQFVEPIISKGKVDSTHSRRTAFSYLRDKHAVTELFGEVATKVGDRPGGYTRIIKLQNRLGDNAEMAIIELVDFNELLVKEPKKGGAKKKRRRRGGAKKAAPAAAAPEAKVEEAAPAPEVATEAAEVKAEEAPVAEAKVEEPKAEEAAPEAKAEAPAAEEVAEAPAKEEAKEEAKADEAEAPEAKADDKKEEKEEKKDDKKDDKA